MGAVTQAASGLFGDLTGANQAAEAGVRAGEIQAAAAREGAAGVDRRFEEFKRLMMPYVTGGQGAFQKSIDLSGAGSPEAQQAMIQGIQGGPEFQAMQQQGQNAILSNASATGGLRGGNVQGALAQFAPQLLAQLINNQFARFSGIAGQGANAAGAVGGGGMQAGQFAADLGQQAGAAEAGGVLAAGNRQRQMFGDLLGLGQIAVGGM